MMRGTRLFYSYAGFITAIALICLMATGMTSNDGKPTSSGQTLMPENAPDTTNPAARFEQPVENIYKNIKVLKGITARELLGSMEFMENALGVGCNYCHVQGNFASDDKPEKETARSMMHMVNEINRNNFSGLTVTCNTCHHGSPHPEAVPSVHQKKDWKQVDMAEAREIAPDSSTTVDQVLSRYVEALGGEAALKRITSRTMKLSQTQEDGPSMTTDVAQKAPNKARLTSTDPNRGAMIRVFDGRFAWAKFGDRDPQALINDRQAQTLRSAEMFPASNLKSGYRDVKLLGKATIDGKTYRIISAIAPDNGHDRFYFDANTGLLARRYVETPTLFGNIPFAISYDDYKSVDGVKVPHTIKWFFAEGDRTDKITEIHQNVKVDDGVFVMPTGK